MDREKGDERARFNGKGMSQQVHFTRLILSPMQVYASACVHETIYMLCFPLCIHLDVSVTGDIVPLYIQ